MSFYRYAVLALCSVLLAGTGYGQAIVMEHNSEVYEEGVDYEVTYQPDAPPDVTILRPSTAGVPYHFECYDSSTEPPYDDAAIASISAAPGIGNVEVKVTGYGGRTYGASEVWLVQIGQTAGTGRLVELKISGNYGHAEQGGTLIADSAGALNIGGDVVKPVEIQRNGALRRV